MIFKSGSGGGGGSDLLTIYSVRAAAILKFSTKESAPPKWITALNGSRFLHFIAALENRLSCRYQTRGGDTKNPQNF